MSYDVYLTETFQNYLKTLKKKYRNIKDDINGKFTRKGQSGIGREIRLSKIQNRTFKKDMAEYTSGRIDRKE